MVGLLPVKDCKMKRLKKQHCSIALFSNLKMMVMCRKNYNGGEKKDFKASRLPEIIQWFCQNSRRLAAQCTAQPTSASKLRSVGP